MGRCWNHLWQTLHCSDSVSQSLAPTPAPRGLADRKTGLYRCESHVGVCCSRTKGGLRTDAWHDQNPVTDVGQLLLWGAVELADRTCAPLDAGCEELRLRKHERLVEGGLDGLRHGASSFGARGGEGEVASV